jgi:hypothetical protein
MSDQAQLDNAPFAMEIVRKRLRFDWCLRDRSGRIIMQGREKSRAEARYRCERALFLLLLTSCRRGVSRATG